MKNIIKPFAIYSAAFVVSYFLMVAASMASPLIENPYSSIKDLLIAAVFIVPLMVLFDFFFIKKNEKG